MNSNVNRRRSYSHDRLSCVGAAIVHALHGKQRANTAGGAGCRLRAHAFAWARGGYARDRRGREIDALRPSDLSDRIVHPVLYMGALKARTKKKVAKVAKVGRSEFVTCGDR